MKGQLFTQFFLTDGIRTTPEWGSAAPKLADFRRDVGSVRQRFGALQQPNEAVTEQDLAGTGTYAHRGRKHRNPARLVRSEGQRSFYTLQELVDLIVDKTLKPLAEERLRAFEARAQDLASNRRSKAERMEVLQRLDPAETVLRLKVLDPAMGSGHFLVSAVDFLSDYIAE